MNDRALRGIRTRWAAIGAAVAISIGGGGIAITRAAVSTGDRGVFVPIAPCRVFDTRPAPDNVGSRNTPLGSGETFTQQITGANGNCIIPADATAIAMNVTAVGGDAASFLTIWPSNVTPRPLVSSLNWIPTSPPTPNKLDVKLSATGQINLFNSSGTVNIIADIVGYQADHNHDDRCYTKAETYNKAETVTAFTNKAEVAAAPYSHPVAGGYVFGGSGTLVANKSFGNISTTRLGTGSYQITLLGYAPGCAPAPPPFLTATLVGVPGFALANVSTNTDCASGNTSLFVGTASITGVATDRDFTFAVYTDG